MPADLTLRTPFAMIFALWGAGLGAAAQYGKVSVIFDQLPQVYPDAGAALGFIVSLVGFVGTFFGVAFTVLAWGGLPLVAVYGLPTLFVAHGLYMAGFAIFLGAKLRRLDIDTPADPISLRQIIKDHGAIYSSPSISAPAAGWLFYTFCFVSVLTVLPPYIDADQRAFVMGAMPLTSIAVSMTFGVAMLRFLSAVQVIVIGFALSAVLMLWLLAVSGDPYACVSLAGALGLIQGASFSAVPELNAEPSKQAQANGAMAQMGNIGNTLGTPVMAATVGAFGYAGLPVLAALAFVLGLLAHLCLASLRKRG